MWGTCHLHCRSSPVAQCLARSRCLVNVCCAYRSPRTVFLLSLRFKSYQKSPCKSSSIYISGEKELVFESSCFVHNCATYINLIFMKTENHTQDYGLTGYKWFFFCVIRVHIFVRVCTCMCMHVCMWACMPEWRSG